MLKIATLVIATTLIVSSAQSESYDEIYKCEISDYGRSTGFGGSMREKKELLASWMSPTVFYVAPVENNAFIHLTKGERIESDRVQFSEDRQKFYYKDYPVSTVLRSKIRKFTLSIMLSDLSFRLDMKLNVAGYVNAGGSATGTCILEENRTIS